jgi:thiol-disulfide isomerase/thioredoxin
MKKALISLAVIIGFFTLLNARALTDRARKTTAVPASSSSSHSSNQKASQKASQKDAPNIGTLKPADFAQFRDSARGKVLVLNFWATWCGPCVAEFPEFVALDAKYRDQGVKIVGITSDDAEDVQPKVIPFIRKHQVKFDIVQQNLEDSEEIMNQITKDWNGVIPVTVVYDRQGKLAYSRFGIIDRELLVAEIEKVLK